MNIKEESEKEQPNNSSQEMNPANFSNNSEVFLQTIQVKLKNNEGKVRTVTVILDSGLNRSYSLKEVV